MTVVCREANKTRTTTRNSDTWKNVKHIHIEFQANNGIGGSYWIFLSIGSLNNQIAVEYDPKREEIEIIDEDE